MKLIVGLGNPGRSYARNRHNVGFQCVDYIAQANRLEINRQQARAAIVFGEIAGEKVILAKPQTFMNLVGESVGPLMRWYRLHFSDLIVIYDDMDLPFGRVRIREKGSAGGHKGVQSIIANLGTQEFPRIRVGIDRPPGEGEHVISYVLSDFSREEQKVVDEVKEKVAEAVEVILTQGIAAAMNRFNV